MSSFKPYMLLAVSLTLCAGCSVTRMTVDVYKPPVVSMPDSIEQIGILNVAMGKINQDINSMVEDLRRGTGSYTYYLSAQRAVQGALEYLEYSEEFRSVLPVKMESITADNRQMPEALDWDFVERLCTDNNLDALITIESIATTNTTGVEMFRQKKQEEKNKVWTNRILYNTEMTRRYVASLTVVIWSGWRVYLPSERNIIDEYFFSDSVLYEMDGYTEEEALEKLPGRGAAVEETGFFIGEQYAARIVPGWSTVQRTFYRPWHSLFNGTTKHLRMRRWGVLSEEWESLKDNPDPGISGMACHNLAVLKEMQGDYPEAVNYINIAAQRINRTVTHRYKTVLENRKHEFVK